MRCALGFCVVLAGALGCKGNKASTDDKPPATPGATPGAAPIDVDWKACEAAVRKAAADPLDARPQRLIDGCRVCGDWTPLLRWNTPQQEGGPTRLAIEGAMAACGYCNANAKQRFLGTLDDARGTNTRAPWRWLGELCKDQVSAVPDNRYTNAPYFALDRIARAASLRGGELANLVAAIELPLPAVSITGSGIVLPDLDSGVVPKAGVLAITLMGDTIHVGKMPRAHLGTSGVLVELGADPYPGKQVTLADLGGELAKLSGGDKTLTITLLAPVAMPAQSLVNIIAAASTVAPIYLAANTKGAPEGWDLPGTIAVALEPGGGDALVITPEMSVQNLATELARRAGNHARRAGITVK